MAQGVPGRLRPQIFLTLGTTRVVGRQPCAPAAFTQDKSLVLVFRGWVNPRAHGSVGSYGKNPQWLILRYPRLPRTVWSGIIINERWTGKAMGGSGNGTIDVISRYMPGATEEQYKILNQDSRYPSSESTQAHRTEVRLAPWISKIWLFSQKSRFVLRCSGLWCQIMFRRNIVPPFSEQGQEEVRFY